MNSRKYRMVSKAVEMAEDPSHGYSQKPPSGRWGPDYDCSSFVYKVANDAGYSVGTGPGGDHARWTGMMTKDFKDAGFQLLPFANVGISGLKIGDILLNLAVHAEIYLGDGDSVGAEMSETGGYSGKAGDQTGEEISVHPVKDVPIQWNFVLRPPEDEREEREDDDMAGYPMGQMNGWAGQTPQAAGYSRPQGYGYQQGGYPMGGWQGYPQGNLGQMNGYSQTSAGTGWPQANQQGAKFVSGVQEANERFVPAGVTDCFLTNDWKHLIVKSADQQGYPSMRVFDIQECMEDMAQQGMGYQQGGDATVTRQEFEQLKEMLQNVQSILSESGNAQGGNGSGSMQAANRSGRS